MAANQIGFRSNLIATIIIFRLLSFFFSCRFWGVGGEHAELRRKNCGGNMI